MSRRENDVIPRPRTDSDPDSDGAIAQNPKSGPDPSMAELAKGTAEGTETPPENREPVKVGFLSRRVVVFRLSSFPFFGIVWSLFVLPGTAFFLHKDLSSER